MSSLQEFLSNMYYEILGKSRGDDGDRFRSLLGRTTTYKTLIFTGVCEYRILRSGFNAKTHVDIYHNDILVVTITKDYSNVPKLGMDYTIHDADEFLALRLSVRGFSWGVDNG